jgi:hypothetical protein
MTRKNKPGAAGGPQPGKAIVNNKPTEIIPSFLKRVIVWLGINGFIPRGLATLLIRAFGLRGA